jgi:hypothetical protein
MGKYIDTCDSTIKMSNVSINPRTKSCHHETWSKSVKHSEKISWWFWGHLISRNDIPPHPETRKNLTPISVSSLALVRNRHKNPSPPTLAPFHSLKCLLAADAWGCQVRYPWFTLHKKNKSQTETIIWNWNLGIQTMLSCCCSDRFLESWISITWK